MENKKELSLNEEGVQVSIEKSKLDVDPSPKKNSLQPTNLLMVDLDPMTIVKEAKISKENIEEGVENLCNEAF